MKKERRARNFLIFILIYVVACFYSLFSYFKKPDHFLKIDISEYRIERQGCRDRDKEETTTNHYNSYNPQLIVI